MLTANFVMPQKEKAVVLNFGWIETSINQAEKCFSSLNDNSSL